MKKVYESWVKDGDSTLALAENIEDLRSRGLVPADARLRYRIEAATFEEAMAIDHLRKGYNPYQPAGKPALCPNGCGCYFYPEGSGDCPLCGHMC
jgi:hypothetical protein